jgi:hypothetical protein
MSMSFRFAAVGDTVFGPSSLLAASAVAAAVAFPGTASAAPAAPPDDGHVVWASNRQDGRHEVYLLSIKNGSDPVRLTKTGADMAVWSPDGRWISYHHSGENSTHVVRWDGTEDHKVCDGYPVFWMHDNTGVVCAVPNPTGIGWEGMSRSEDYLVGHPDLGTQTPLFKRSTFKHLRDDTVAPGPKNFVPGGITNDGRWLVGWVFEMFNGGYTADNGRFDAPHSSVAFDLTDPDKIFFIGSGCTTTTPYVGSLVYHVSRAGTTAPDIYSLDMKDLATRASYKKVVGRADAEFGHDYFPKISTDNKWLTYAASLGCHDWFQCDYEIFVHQLGAPDTESVRLTASPSNDNYPHMYVGELWQAEPEKPRIGLSPNRLHLAGSMMQPPAARKVIAFSTGGKPLGSAEAKIVYQSGADWLEVARADAGNGNFEFTIQVKPAPLPSGVYRASVEIDVPGAAGGAKAVNVELAYTSPIPGPPPPDGGAPGSDGGTPTGPGGAPGTGGSVGMGGVPGAGGTAPADAGGTGPGATGGVSGTKAPAGDSGGCQVGAGGQSVAAGPGAFLVFGLVTLVSRALGRRRRAP